MTAKRYTPADFDTMTGRELDEVWIEYGVPYVPPATWKFMSVSSKREWLTEYSAKLPKEKPTMADQDHADAIDAANSALNTAINAAARAGLEIAADVLHRNIISGHEAVPFVVTRVLRPVFPKE